MRVKVGKRIYNSDKLPIMLVLSDEEKKQLTAMDPAAHKFAVVTLTDEFTEEQAREWMKLPDDANRATLTTA